MEEQTKDLQQQTDIEEESQGNTIIEMPFNPNMIKIKRDPFTLGQLIDKMKYKEVRFDTPYQRKADLWDDCQKSRLIESVLLRLPLPAFYFDEYDEINQLWNVVDGLQRCSAFDHFINKCDLRLTDLEFLGSRFNSFLFSDLPSDLRRRILQTPLTIYVIAEGTPEIVKYNIFKRINTGGLILSPQEIRHAMNVGVANELIGAMASSTAFKTATCYKIPSDRMEDQDFVTRFVAFKLQGYNHYKPDLDSFMTIGMSAIRKLTTVEQKELESSFERAMAISKDVFGNDAFRKRLDKNDRRKPINKALFEVESVAFSELSDEQSEKLISQKYEFLEAFMNLCRDDRFYRSLSSGTGQKETVAIRHGNFKNLLKKFIG